MKHPKVMSYPYWRNILNGRRRINWAMAKKLAACWDMEPQDLMDLPPAQIEQIFLEKEHQCS